MGFEVQRTPGPSLQEAIRQAGLLAGLVRWEHTIFALPLAYAGAMLGARGWPSGWQWFWITAAMVGARTAAMAINRIVDREIDARNPRTKDRHLPRGLVTVSAARGVAFGGLALLVAAAWALGPVCVAFLPLVVPVLVLYSYTKRFTWACHYALAAAQFFGPFGGWIATSGRVESGAVAMGAAVGLWVGGFDILYACQDIAFDRESGLHSLPADLGVSKALWMARATHAATGLLLAWVGLQAHLPWPYWLGVATALALLAGEHGLVSPRDLSRVPLAFFQMNSLVSIALFLGVAASTWMGWH